MRPVRISTFLINGMNINNANRSLDAASQAAGKPESVLPINPNEKHQIRDAIIK